MSWCTQIKALYCEIKGLWNHWFIECNPVLFNCLMPILNWKWYLMRYRSISLVIPSFNYQGDKHIEPADFFPNGVCFNESNSLYTSYPQHLDWLHTSELTETFAEKLMDIFADGTDPSAFFKIMYMAKFSLCLMFQSLYTRSKPFTWGRSCK